MSLFSIDPSYRDKCRLLLEDLFPIYRTLMGEGFNRSLQVIEKIIPLRIHRFPSGSKCGSWTIPKEWYVREAFIQDSAGNRIIDFNKSSFHIWQYSVPFSGEVSRKELFDHLSTSPHCPDAIPLCVTYYRNNWGFALSEKLKNQLSDERYFVHIDSGFKAGFLCVGEFFLPGKRKEEILIDAVLSCTSLANNISGVVAAVYIGELISQLQSRYFSYRIIFTPETVGPLCLHFLLDGFKKKVIGGYTLVNLAYKDVFHYKKSRPGNSVADQGMGHSLRFFKEPYVIQEYDVLTGTCGNEKAYNSLGIEIPLGAFRRSPFNSYAEYDTSNDNLSLIKTDKIYEALQVLWGAVQAIERARFYVHRFEGEPFLTGYGLFPKIEKESDRIAYDYLMGYTTGDLSLIEIAEKANMPVTSLDEPVRLMEEKGLIAEVRGGG